MRQGPSRTALAAASHRAAHQFLDSGAIFADPLAVRIIGGDPTDIARDAEARPSGRGGGKVVCVPRGALGRRIE